MAKSRIKITAVAAALLVDSAGALKITSKDFYQAIPPMAIPTSGFIDLGDTQ